MVLLLRSKQGLNVRSIQEEKEEEEEDQEEKRGGRGRRWGNVVDTNVLLEALDNLTEQASAGRK